MIKKLLAVILFVMVTSLSVAGCTTSTTTPTVQTTTSPPNQATVTAVPAPTSADLSAKLNNAFTSKNYTLVVPFTRAVNQYGNVVYTGVIKDGENKLVPFNHNITVEETKNRSDSLARFSAYVAQVVANGYSVSVNQTGSWVGHIGNFGDVDQATAYVHIGEPNSYISGWDTYTSVSDTGYTVLSEYSTKA